MRRKAKAKVGKERDIYRDEVKSLMKHVAKLARRVKELEDWKVETKQQA